MELNFRDFGGEGIPIVILHGLFGSSKNWVKIGAYLSRYGHCYAVDQRNHGDSPHDDSHSLMDLVGDLSEWVEANQIQHPVLLGHSMGGMVAMKYALLRPDAVSSLIIVDIAPKTYTHTHPDEYRAMRTDLTRYATRGEIDRAMEQYVPDRKVRQFLQMNIARVGKGFSWKINVDALESSTFLNDASSLTGRCGAPSLFLVGGKSDYVHGDDASRILSLFPNAEMSILPEGDHWMHYSSAEEFIGRIEQFFTKHSLSLWNG